MLLCCMLNNRCFHSEEWRGWRFGDTLMNFMKLWSDPFHVTDTVVILYLYIIIIYYIIFMLILYNYIIFIFILYNYIIFMLILYNYIIKVQLKIPCPLRYIRLPLTNTNNYRPSSATHHHSKRAYFRGQRLGQVACRNWCPIEYSSDHDDQVYETIWNQRWPRGETRWRDVSWMWGEWNQCLTRLVSLIWPPTSPHLVARLDSWQPACLML